MKRLALLTLLTRFMFYHGSKVVFTLTAILIIESVLLSLIYEPGALERMTSQAMAAGLSQ